MALGTISSVAAHAARKIGILTNMTTGTQAERECAATEPIAGALAQIPPVAAAATTPWTFLVPRVEGRRLVQEFRRETVSAEYPRPDEASLRPLPHHDKGPTVLAGVHIEPLNPPDNPNANPLVLYDCERLFNPHGVRRSEIFAWFERYRASRRRCHDVSEEAKRISWNHFMDTLNRGLLVKSQRRGESKRTSVARCSHFRRMTCAAGSTSSAWSTSWSLAMRTILTEMRATTLSNGSSRTDAFSPRVTRVLTLRTSELLCKLVVRGLGAPRQASFVLANHTRDAFQQLLTCSHESLARG